jgi:alkylhydroperoxidase/carboxymuconolactone decarboxylase family protein YurZ
VHRKAALNAGVTEQELVEATFVAAALRAGGAVAHVSIRLPQAPLRG